jgi:predicted branched-subunit amino acid permease
MRKSVLAGLLLACAAVLVVFVSSALDLELESVALLGAALGAVVALVPDRSPLVRLGGFAAGFLAAWIGYAARAALLPDTAGGRAVAVGLVVLLCVGISAASVGRLPLWTLLLGTAALAGAYEFTYVEAPPEMASTSLSAATTLLFNVAVGFLAAAFVAPVERSGQPRRTAAEPDTDSNARLDDIMMENAK